MKLLYLVILQGLFAAVSTAQSGLNLEIAKADASGESKQECVQLIVNNDNAQDELWLSSQNYRMYYDANSGTLNENTLKLNLPEDKYQLRLVQHVDGVDATGTGGLAFEDNLGFINFSIVQTNLQQPGIALSSEQQPVISMCFDPKEGGVKPLSIVMARADETSAYGRAYIELSSLGAKKELKTTKIISYKDYINQ